MAVRGQLGTDDSIQIVIGTQTVYANGNACHHYGNSGVIQYEFEAVLKKGVNRIMVKLYEGCGHWAYRLRFLDAETCAIIKGSDDYSIESEPPTGLPDILAQRDLPDQVQANDLMDVLIDIGILSGAPGAAVVKEKLPLFYEYVDGSASNGGSFADGVITWNLPAPLKATTLSYQAQAPDTIAAARFSGTVEVDGYIISIGGESSIGGTDPGWMKNWLILDGIFQFSPVGGGAGGDNPGVNRLLQDWITDGDLISEVTIVPSDGLTIRPDFGGAAAGEGFYNGQKEGAWRANNDADGCIDLNVLFAPNDQVMSYGATYVENPLDEELELYMGVGSDDSIKVLLNGSVVFV
ncbi:MAG: Ig-like domain-containing protein, partial [Thermoanaerobaculia bacterium]